MYPTSYSYISAILAFLHTDLTNARTEGFNRLVKQVKRVACGFRNTENSRRRIRLHCTRAQRASIGFTTRAIARLTSKSLYERPWDTGRRGPKFTGCRATDSRSGK